jgi:putative membrane protein
MDADSNLLIREVSLTIRDILALERTHLANERTLLAYIRTAIMVGVSGTTLLKFFPDNTGAQVTGWSLLPIGMVTVAIGLRQFVRMRKAITGRQIA